MIRQFSKSNSCQREGLSLLEVILALAILGISLAAIGELIRVGARHAEVSRKRTTAQLLCENKLAEIKAGWLGQSVVITTGQKMRPQPVGPVEFEPHETDQPWIYTVTVEMGETEGLLVVEVIVEEVTEAYRPLRYSLAMWMIDPELEWLQKQAVMAAEEGTGG
ncbi:MAG: prepilin-type N-terminal cleavage/methylation domain-containing protein [Pirellulaceae bacterium]